MQKTTLSNAQLPLAVNPASLVHRSGILVDFDFVPDSYQLANTLKKQIPAGTVMSKLTSSNKFVPRKDTIGAPSGITRSSTTATVTQTAHGYATGDTVTISGADQSEYNGTFVITVTGDDTYTYTVSGSPDTPATGTLASVVDASCILFSNADEDSKSDAKSGYGAIVGGGLYENLLPDATGNPKELPAAYKTELAAAGTGFFFEQYTDNR